MGGAERRVERITDGSGNSNNPGDQKTLKTLKNQRTETEGRCGVGFLARDALSHSIQMGQGTTLSTANLYSTSTSILYPMQLPGIGIAVAGLIFNPRGKARPRSSGAR